MSIIIMILLLSLLILVHEAGHFFVARACGIKVDKFGFGLPVGPTLFKKKVGDVEILVHAFLLGGYVSFPDDDPKRAGCDYEFCHHYTAQYEKHLYGTDPALCYFRVLYLSAQRKFCAGAGFFVLCSKG